jgi:DNA polymerase
VIDDIAYEWESRTGMVLEFDLFSKVFQKDVNNYVMVDFDGKYKTKGAYVKKLNNLDYDLPIVNEALVKFMVENVPIEKTITECDDYKKFQKIVKVSGKYLYGLKNATFTTYKSKKFWNKDGEKLNDKTFRVFASRRSADGGIFKLKNLESNPESFANTPEKCFIDNEDVNDKRIPIKLDKSWYVDMANERLRQFGVS